MRPFYLVSGGLFQCIQQARESLCATLQFAFPNYQNSPSQPTEGVACFFVSVFVFSELGFPELRPGLWDGGIFASLMLMPKTAVDKDTHLELRQYNIGLARQLLAVESVAITLSMEELPNKQLRPSVFPFDTRHHFRSSGWINNVHSNTFLHSVVS